MTDDAHLIRHSWSVGDKHTATLTIRRPHPCQPIAMAVEWSPAVPGQLNAAEWLDYRRGRDAVLAEAAQALGIAVAVVEA